MGALGALPREEVAAAPEKHWQVIGGLTETSFPPLCGDRLCSAASASVEPRRTRKGWCSGSEQGVLRSSWDTLLPQGGGTPPRAGPPSEWHLRWHGTRDFLQQRWGGGPQSWKMAAMRPQKGPRLLLLTQGSGLPPGDAGAGKRRAKWDLSGTLTPQASASLSSGPSWPPLHSGHSLCDLTRALPPGSQRREPVTAGPETRPGQSGAAEWWGDSTHAQGHVRTAASSKTPAWTAGPPCSWPLTHPGPPTPGAVPVLAWGRPVPPSAPLSLWPPGLGQLGKCPLYSPLQS